MLFVMQQYKTLNGRFHYAYDGHPQTKQRKPLKKVFIELHWMMLIDFNDVNSFSELNKRGKTEAVVHGCSLVQLLQKNSKFHG